MVPKLTRRMWLATPAALAAPPPVARLAGTHLRVALNAYSFNQPLRDGSMTLSGLVRYCAQNGIDALDATGYYFPGYPKVPTDDYIYALKREAFLNGVTIHGTGVRNDFTSPGRTDIDLVKNWIEVAEKLGASILRVFSGPKAPEGKTFDQVLEWMIPAFQECADYGQKHGVLLGLQHHNDFLKTADETLRVVERVNHPWFGVLLDIGSLRQADPYPEIEKLVPYAFSWQLKENVGVYGKETPTDLRRVKAIIEKAGYRGFLPIETLGAGDPHEKVRKFLAEVRSVFGAGG